MKIGNESISFNFEEFDTESRLNIELGNNKVNDANQEVLTDFDNIVNQINRIMRVTLEEPEKIRLQFEEYDKETSKGFESND